MMKRNNVARGHHLIVIGILIAIAMVSFLGAHLKATRGKCNFRPGQCGEQQVPDDKAVLQVRVHTVVLLSANLMLHRIREAEPFKGIAHARKVRIGHLLLQVVLVNALGKSAELREIINKKSKIIIEIAKF